MSTFTLMRLYLKYHNMPRLPLPCIGYAGTLYSSSLLDRQRYSLRDEGGRSTPYSELVGTSKLLVKKGSMGSYYFRRYSTTTGDITKAEKERMDKNKFKLKTLETVKIMVVSETGSVSSMTLEEANKLAKRKGLNLVHITNPKEKPVRSEKKIYKLVSKLANLEEGEENEDGASKPGRSSSGDNKQKELKTVLMKSTIGEHDANAKINSMKKWIMKGHRIRVQISQVGDKGNAEAVFQNIEERMLEVEGQMQQKITKGNELRFYIGPPKKSAKSTSKIKERQEDKKDHDEDEDSDDDEVPKKRNRNTSKS